MLRLDGVTVRVPGAVLLDGVTLDVPAGALTALVGPNGAGKSTLLRVASGERAPDAGTVTMVGADGRMQPHAGAAPDDLARRRAVLPQESLLAFPFTSAEVAQLGRTPHRTGREADAESVARALDAVGVAALADRRYPTLSGGEKQRVHLARVLAQLDSGEAVLLLLDEPTNNLDLTHQHRVLEVARQMARRGLAVVAVLHDLNLAAQYADRIALLKRGRLVAAGSPADVLTSDAIAEAFDVRALVMPHPCLACPLVVPVPHGTPMPQMPPYGAVAAAGGLVPHAVNTPVPLGPDLPILTDPLPL